ncbi:MAG: hypothetical protein LLG37_01750 [Spirochaetia bacterium]|nr:hypothetical protein [Spirochaetia bacterium]
MYAILSALFTLILGTAIYGMIRYGFNIVFMYIAIFSLVVVVWTVAVIVDENRGKNPDA